MQVVGLASVWSTLVSHTCLCNLAGCDRYENPADVAAIQYAERNMGDYKLKSDPAYIVPEVRPCAACCRGSNTLGTVQEWTALPGGHG